MRVLGYLDPGSGAMIGSAIAGIGAAAAVAVKANAQRFARLVSPKKRRADAADAAEAEAAPADQ